MPAKYLHVAALVGLLLTVQLLTSLLDAQYLLTQLTMTAYYSLLIIGLCLLIGYAGQISLGHAGFFSIGGYISGLLTTYDFSRFRTTPVFSVLSKAGVLMERQDLYGETILNFHPWPACIIAVLAAALIAHVIGRPVLKLHGHYLAMATLGFGIIIYRIVLGTGLLGAADGISDVPGFGILPGIEISGSGARRVQNFYIAWGLVVAGMLLLANLIDSRVGRALAAIHGAEDAADAMGIDTARYKLKTFVLSAVFAAVAGVLLTHYNGGIGPSEASVMKSVRYVAIVAVGGMANVWGALTMSTVLNFLSLRGYFGTLDDAVFGFILILIMLFSPEGLLRADVLRMVTRAVRRGSPEGGV